MKKLPLMPEGKLDKKVLRRDAPHRLSGNFKAEG